MKVKDSKIECLENTSKCELSKEGDNKLTNYMNNMRNIRMSNGEINQATNCMVKTRI